MIGEEEFQRIAASLIAAETGGPMVTSIPPVMGAYVKARDDIGLVTAGRRSLTLAAGTVLWLALATDSLFVIRRSDIRRGGGVPVSVDDNPGTGCSGRLAETQMCACFLPSQVHSS